MTERELCNLATRAMGSAYAPYSRHTVGAALLAASGKVYCGGNIENAAYSPTICAERTAFAKAVSEGEREFVMLAVAGGMEQKIDGACFPCGVCRQVMAEFCGPDLPVLIVTGEDTFERHTLSELLPHSFAL